MRHDIFVLAPTPADSFTLIWQLISNIFTDASWFLQNFATALSVVVAVTLYLLKIWRDKRNAAMILLIEIRNAERAILDIKNSGTVSETTLVMPVSSWKKFQHYFVKDLNNDEFELINHFYNLALVIQKEIERMKNHWPISNEEKIRVTQQILGALAQEFFAEAKDLQPLSDDYVAKRDKIYSILHKESKGFEPGLPATRILSYLPNIRFITSTTCGEKLRKIAGAKY